VAEHRPLDSLVRTLYDLRLALVALATIVEVAGTPSMSTVLALLAALPVSYLPLRRWATLGPWMASRRTWLLLDAVFAAVLTVLVTDPQIMLIYSVATVMLAALVGGRLGAALVSGVLVAFLALGTVLTTTAGSGSASGYATSLAFAALYVVTALGSLRLTRLMAAYDTAVDSARAASRRAAQAEERGRLAREMHDSLSKTIQGTHLMALAVSKRLRADGAEPALRDAADRLVMACDIATRDARRLLHGLRDDGEQAETTSVSRRLEQVVLEWQTRTATPAHVEAGTRPGSDELPAQLVYETCCIVGEALDNAHRHGRAAQVRVRWAHRDGWLDVTVADDGAGFEVPADLATLHRAGHYGLVGMRERAQRIGGTLAVASAPQRGTTVTVTVPAPELGVDEAPPPAPVPDAAGDDPRQDPRPDLARPVDAARP
jgi:signal transduction histidine kinase